MFHKKIMTNMNSQIVIIIIIISKYLVNLMIHLIHKVIIKYNRENKHIYLLQKKYSNLVNKHQENNLIITYKAIIIVKIILKDNQQHNNQINPKNNHKNKNKKKRKL